MTAFRAPAALRCPPPASWKSMCTFFISGSFFMSGLLHAAPEPYREQAPCHVDNATTRLCSMSSMGTFTQISRLFHGLFISVLHHRFMRCDLHVHSTASGMCNTPGLQRVCRE